MRTSIFVLFVFGLISSTYAQIVMKPLNADEVEVSLGPPYEQSYVVPLSWILFACKVYQGQKQVHELGGEAPDPNTILKVELSPGIEAKLPLAFVPFIAELYKIRQFDLSKVLEILSPAPEKDDNDKEVSVIIGSEKVVIPKTWAAYISAIWTGSQLDRSGNVVPVNEQQKLVDVPLEAGNTMKIPKGWIPFFASIWKLKNGQDASKNGATTSTPAYTLAPAAAATTTPVTTTTVSTTPANTTRATTTAKVAVN